MMLKNLRFNWYKFAAFFLKSSQWLFKINTDYIYYAIKSHLKNKSGIILEIGSQNGEDTLKLSSLSSINKVFSFEPDPRLESYLINKFKKIKNIIFYPYAVTNLKGSLKFYASEIKGNNFKNSGSSSLLKSSHNDGINNVFEVQTIALNDIKEIKHNNILLIWVDVQGAEQQVIESGKTFFFNSKLIWIEYGESKYEQFLSREETIKLFSNTHYVSIFSNRSKRGNLLLVKK